MAVSFEGAGYFDTKQTDPDGLFGQTPLAELSTGFCFLAPFYH
jgi:hypothetical protein